MADRRRVSVPPAIAASGAAVPAVWWAGGPYVGLAAAFVWAVVALPPAYFTYRLGRQALDNDGDVEAESPSLYVHVTRGGDS
ncbi:MAG TPA: hypothetical protein VF519_17985 [Mycobacteriales bacterium]|jgi:hypothetical protein